jgi:hypothetical protein
MASIDITKVTKSFDHLAESKNGQQTLIGFRQAIETLRSGIPSSINLNNHEFLAVLQKLVTQMNADDLRPEGSGGLSDAQLEQVAGGVSSPMFSVASVTRLGDVRSIGNLGFNIRTVA